MAFVTIIPDLTKSMMLSAVSGTDIKIALLSADGYLTNGVIPGFILEGYNNWSIVSGAEVAANGSYTAGGVSLSGISTYYTSYPSTDAAWYDGNSVTWSSVTVSATAAVIYRSTIGTVVEIIRFDTYQIAQSGPFTISWPSNHIIQMIG